MQLSDIRSALAAAADGVSGGDFELSAARIKLAYSQYSPTDEIFRTMLSAGPYLVILEGEKIQDINGEALANAPKRYRVSARLYVGFARETDNDFLNIELFVEALANEWRASNIGVIDTSWMRPEINIERNPALAMYTLQAEILGC